MSVGTAQPAIPTGTSVPPDPRLPAYPREHFGVLPAALGGALGVDPAMSAPSVPMASDDALQNALQGISQEFSIDVNKTHDNQLSATALNAKDTPDPTPREDLGGGQATDPMAAKAMEALYGHEFPFLKDNPNSDDWATWARALWTKHGPGVQPRLHMVERNRLMRKGIQWVSERFGTWREPPKPRDSARVVDNMIAPALDQRTQIIADQRPGFRAKPESQEQRNLKKAEAQQIAVEYQYDSQKMPKILREASYWNGTDGVCFLHPHWDAEAGPWDEVLMPVPQAPQMPGQPPQQPQGDRMTPTPYWQSGSGFQDTPVPGVDGEPLPMEFAPVNGPLGDIRTRILRIEQVRVSAEATATIKPSYWIVRETIPQAVAVKEYGPEVLEPTADMMSDGQVESSRISTYAQIRGGTNAPDQDDLIRDQRTVDRFTVYAEKSEYLKQGLTLVVIGRKTVAGPLPLLCGRVPLVRFTDGSTDPSFYPQAQMENWIDSQMRVNALLSGWVDSVRVNKGGRFLAKEGAISGETFVGGMVSIIGVKGGGNISNTVSPVPGFSVGEDLKELIAREKKCFEDLSGWSDNSRGSFSSDQSGRAILAQREALERVFAPSVNAAAEAMVDWAEICIQWMRWGYDYPRMISAEGSGRPDLAHQLTQDDFDGIANVTIDPETLMPMPRALRLFLLDSMLEKGAMSLPEYRRRLPFAFTQNIDTPDTDQASRAKRICESIRTNQPIPPMLWMDDESIHQDILERELILPDDLDPMIRQQAYQRWMELAQQSQMKMGGMPPQMQQGNGKSPVGKHGVSQNQLPARQQPMQGTNPSIASAPASVLGGSSDQQRAGVQADAMSHQ